LRAFAIKASTPDKLVSDGNKPPEIRFDEIDFKMVNTSYESIMLWNTLWSTYEGGINQLPPKVDVDLYKDTMSLLRDIINKLNTLKGSTKVPKSDSPLTYEAGYGVACIDFAPSKPK